MLFYEVAATRAPIHSPSNHSELQLPALNLPACYSLHFGKTESKQSVCSLPNSDRRGVHGKREKENNTNSHGLIQQWKKPACYPRAFWSEVAGVEAPSTSCALHLLGSPCTCVDVTCYSRPGTRRGEIAGPVTKQHCPKQGLQIHVLAQHSAQTSSPVHISTAFAQFPATAGNFTDFF